MTETATIDGESPQQKPADHAGMLRAGRVAALLRSVLSGTRLLHRTVRSLSRRVDDGIFPDHRQKFTCFLLLKQTHALMLAGIRCAGAGGGGPGR